MPTVKVHFPGGRYHATPWGHHVNEGLVEWPPCPWRLLRALLATGFTKLGWHQVPPLAQQLTEKLAAVLPRYHLPPASVAHSRHYMPLVEGKALKTTLVFDTWAQVGDGELRIHWPCELDAQERNLLGQLAAELGYLGRSESWAHAELVDDTPEVEWNAVPCQEGEHRGPGWEQVALMAAMPAEEYRAWRLQQTAEPSPASAKKGRGAKKGPSAKESPYPPDLLACLTKDSTWWKGHGWSQPPGSRRVLYWRKADALEVYVPPIPRRRAPPPVACMLLAITTPSGNRSALPPVTRTLPQAELLHRTLVGRLARGGRLDCPALTGKDEQGRPLRGHRHAHAHTIPLDLDGDGHLDHVLIYAAMGLCPAAQQAIRALRRTWSKGGVGELQLAVVGSGDLESLRRLPGRWSRAVEAILSPPGGACVWHSVTPFVPPKTPDGRRSRQPLALVNRELASRGLPPAQSVEIDLDLTRRLRHFVRRRGHGGVPPKVDVGWGLKLTFAQPICGPLLLGYAAHYGLGLFAVAGKASQE
jgi:CRISPR-associated protein Csb2